MYRSYIFFYIKTDINEICFFFDIWISLVFKKLMFYFYVRYTAI